MTSPLFDLERMLPEAELWPCYRRLREEAPIHRVADRENVYILSRYEDVRAVLTDAGTFSSSLVAGAESPLLVLSDGERHRRLRAVLAAAFTPAAIELLREVAERAADERSRELVRARRGEVVSSWCQPIPCELIGAILGVPPARQSEFLELAYNLNSVFFANAVPGEREASSREKLTALLPAGLQLARALGPARGLAMLRRVAAAAPERGAALSRERLASCRGIAAFLAFFGRVVRAQRRHPQPNVLGLLIGAARGGEHGPQATEIEVLMQGLALIVAGIDTTASLFANAVHALCEDRALLSTLQQQPARTGAFVAETLRLWSPVQRTDRRAVRPTVIRGEKIPENAHLVLLLAAANRDPERFERPDELRLDRGAGGHLAFGLGPHVCLGRNLALLEAETALTTLLAQVATLDLDPERPAVRIPHPAVFGFTELPVVITPR
ncbi:MAG: cytochrome P450 [Myxococcota bacterium]|nr:cytochrome P450 [Myxococcota bacterium]